MCGPVTTKLAEAISPLIPCTETVYVPGVIGDATTKLLPVNWPEELIVQAGVANSVGTVGDCISGRHVPASAVLKPLPVNVTPVPEGPPVGLRVIVGAFVVTVKVALAASPLLPVTVIVYTPGVAEVATVNALVTNWPLVLMVHDEATFTISGVGGPCE
jgi:hypothetical protein